MRSTEKPKTEHPCKNFIEYPKDEHNLMCYRPVSRKIAIFNAFLMIRWLHLLHLYPPPPFWGSRILEGMQRLYWKLHSFSQLVQYTYAVSDSDETFLLDIGKTMDFSIQYVMMRTSYVMMRPSYVMMRTSLTEVLLSDFLCVLQVTQQHRNKE